MKFGVREICNVTFKAKSNVTIGNTTFKVGQPVLYIDSAKTSTLEGAATTVYAQGGRGNTRLIAWEGEKTLTFTVEDALLSPLGLSVLSGAGLLRPGQFRAADNTGGSVRETAAGQTPQFSRIDCHQDSYRGFSCLTCLCLCRQPARTRKCIRRA